MPLAHFQSLCDPQAKIVTSVDRGNPRAKHVAYNSGGKNVTHYKMDGVVFKGNSCDFLLFNETDRIAFMIELKGSDLTKAAEQLETTEKRLGPALSGYRRRYRIAANKCRTHQIQDSKFLKYKVRWGASLKYASGVLEEVI